MKESSAPARLITSVMFLAVSLVLTSYNALAQVGAGTGSAAACSHVSSTVSKGARPAWKSFESKVNTRETLYTISFADERTGLVAGARAVYKTADGGDTWEQVRLAIPKRLAVTNVSFTGPSTGWVLLGQAGYEYDKEQLRLLRTTDGGKTWRVQLKRDKVIWGSVSFPDQQNVWLAGNSTQNRQFEVPLILHSSNQGEDWVDVSADLLRVLPANKAGYRPRITNIAASSGVDATVSTSDGRVFVTDDGGHVWRKLEYKCVDDDNLRWPGTIMGLKGGSSLWMASGADSIEGYWGNIFERQNDGSWVRYDLPNFALADAAYISESHVFAVGATLDRNRGRRSGTVLFSTDNGLTWAVVHKDDGVERIYALTVLNPRRAWAVGSHGSIFRLEAVS
jgi:photosystem II stability/assembly factor-like uncharacterized protein